MNSYELSRGFIDWAFENPHKVKPIHYAIYFFAIEHCNRLGWKKVFGFPSNMAMEAIGVKNWRTYSSALNDLVDFGFIEMIEISKNQYSSNIVAIVKNTKASTKAQSKALDKALSKHSQKHSTKQGQSTVSIDKQETIQQLNNEPLNKEQVDSAPSENPKASANFQAQLFLLQIGVEKQHAIDFLKNRKNKKLANTETAFRQIVAEINKTGHTPDEIIKLCAQNGWGSFKSSWNWQETAPKSKNKYQETDDLMEEIRQKYAGN